MAHIKEPKGVDFIIQSEPLTNKARVEISEFIKNYKSKEIVKTNNLFQIKKQKPVLA